MFLIMFHPDLQDKVADTVDKLCELRKIYPFDLSMELIRGPENFTQYHKHYTEEQFKWARSVQERFRQIDRESKVEKRPIPEEKGWTFVVKRKEKGLISEQENVSVEELDDLTGCCFRGMSCCVGTSVIDIMPDGTSRGLVCGLAADKYNIFQENPFREGGIIRTIQCKKNKCTCNVDYRTPKFLDKAEADSFVRSCQLKQQKLTEDYISCYSLKGNDRGNIYTTN